MPSYGAPCAISNIIFRRGRTDVARNEIVIAAPPERVFETLADGRSYGHWVVGSSEIESVDSNWPAVGSRFHHKVGWGPLKVADHTEVIRSEPPRMLEL